MPANNPSNSNVSLILTARRQLDEVLRNFDALVVEGTMLTIERNGGGLMGVEEA